MYTYNVRTPYTFVHVHVRTPHTFVHVHVHVFYRTFEGFLHKIPKIIHCQYIVRHMWYIAVGNESDKLTKRSGCVYLYPGYVYPGVRWS